jgi:hypothetical protein
MASQDGSSSKGDNSAMTNSDTKRTSPAMATGIATALVAASAKAGEAEDKFLAGIRSDDEDANYAA